MSCLDPSILRLAKQPTRRGERETLTVPSQRGWAAFAPGQRYDIGPAGAERPATVVSWDEASGELVVEYDSPRSPEFVWTWLS